MKVKKKPLRNKKSRHGKLRPKPKPEVDSTKAPPSRLEMPPSGWLRELPKGTWRE